LENITYKIRFRKGDFEAEAQGDRDWVERKFKELVSEDFKASLPKELSHGDMTDTLGEFLDIKGNPQKHTDVVAVYAYWLFKKEGFQSFNVKNIIDCYDKTRRAKPKNPNQIINANVSSHLFSEASEKKESLKAWVITRTGEEYVEQMK
jgi:hypothetical protein